MPFEADAQVIVDADTPLASAIALQPLQPISGWIPKIKNVLCHVQINQPSCGHASHAPKAPTLACEKHFLRFFVFE